MVLTFQHRSFADIVGPRQWLPMIASWIALIALIAFLGWSYFSNPKPGPYGVCYQNHGRDACPTTH